MNLHNVLSQLQNSINSVLYMTWVDIPTVQRAGHMLLADFKI